MPQEHGGARRGDVAGAEVGLTEHHVNSCSEHAVDAGEGVGELLGERVGQSGLFLGGGGNHALGGKDLSQTLEVLAGETVFPQDFQRLHDLLFFHGNAEIAFGGHLFRGNAVSQQHGKHGVGLILAQPLVDFGFASRKQKDGQNADKAEGPAEHAI